MDGARTLGTGRRMKTKTVAGARVAEEEVRGRVAAMRQKTGLWGRGSAAGSTGREEESEEITTLFGV